MMRFRRATTRHERLIYGCSFVLSALALLAQAAGWQ